MPEEAPVIRTVLPCRRWDIAEVIVRVRDGVRLGRSAAVDWDLRSAIDDRMVVVRRARVGNGMWFVVRGEKRWIGR